MFCYKTLRVFTVFPVLIVSKINTVQKIQRELPPIKAGYPKNGTFQNLNVFPQLYYNVTCYICEVLVVNDHKRYERNLVRKKEHIPVCVVHVKKTTRQTFIHCLHY